MDLFNLTIGKIGCWRLCATSNFNTVIRFVFTYRRVHAYDWDSENQPQCWCLLLSFVVYWWCHCKQQKFHCPRLEASSIDRDPFQWFKLTETVH